MLRKKTSPDMTSHWIETVSAIYCPQRQAHGGQAPAAAGQGQGHDHEGPPVHGDADYEWLADLLGASLQSCLLLNERTEIDFCVTTFVLQLH